MAAIVYPFVVGDERLSLVEFMRVDETAVLIPFIGAVAFGGLCFVAFRLRRDLEVAIDGALREEADYQDAIAGRWFTH